MIMGMIMPFLIMPFLIKDWWAKVPSKYDTMTAEAQPEGGRFGGGPWGEEKTHQKTPPSRGGGVWATSWWECNNCHTKLPLRGRFVDGEFLLKHKTACRFMLPGEVQDGNKQSGR